MVSVWIYMKCQFNPIPSKPFRSSICWKGNSFPHFCPKNHPPARRDLKYAEWKAPITSMKDVSREKVQIQMAFKKIITSSLVLRLKSLTDRFRESADSHSQFTYTIICSHIQSYSLHDSTIQMTIRWCGKCANDAKCCRWNHVGGKTWMTWMTWMMENRLRIGQVTIDHWNLQSNHEPRMEPQPYGCIAQETHHIFKPCA